VRLDKLGKVAKLASMRVALTKVHRWLGLCCGGVIFLVCLSGAVLSFEDEIASFLDGHLITDSEAQVSVQEVYSAAQSHLLSEELVQRIHLPLGRIKVEGPLGTRILFFHPKDGQYLGVGSSALSWTLDLHRRLLLSDSGRWLTLMSCLGFLSLTLSGLKLWWPKKWHKLPAGLAIKTTASRRRLFLDIHRVVGAYIAIPIILIAFTGLNFSKAKDPYRNAILTLTQAAPIAKAKPLGDLGPTRLTLDQILERALQVYPEASVTSIDLPETQDGPMKVRFRHPSQPGEFGRSEVLLHPGTGEVLRALNAMELPLGQRLIHVWALPLHQGRAFGTVHQILWLLVALAGASLPLTGVWLWYTKGRKLA
jgi:uncharacterized iron-regulated membrane protein